MKNKFSMAFSLAVVMAMLVTSLALADTVEPDNDFVTTGNQTSINLGNVAPGATLTPQVSFTLVCAGNNHVDNPQSVSVAFTSAGSSFPLGGSLGASTATIGATSGDVGVPIAWPDDGSNCSSAGSPAPVSDNGNSTVTIGAPNAAGNYTYTVKYSAAPTPAGSNDSSSISGSVSVTFTLTVVAPPSDNTAPVISYVLTPSLPDGSNGWYKSNVSLVWTVTDPESSVSKTGCVDQNIIADQAATTYSCSASSAGGSAAPVNVTIKRDATAPSGVSGAPDRAPDNGTWYNQAVDVDFTGTDARSGIASCTTTTYSGPDGSGVSVNGSCTDNAGNTSASVASSSFNYDGSGPTGVVLTVTAGTPGSNGWYTSDVTVHTSSDADISGVTCTTDQFQTTETAGAVFNGSCTNGAGLTSNAASLTVKLDKTGPSAALAVTAGTAGLNGWYTSDVTVSTSGSDSISGPASCTVDQFQTTETTGQAFNGSCTNAAGLSTNAASLTVKLDKTGPSAALAVTAGTAGLNGWYTSDVTVSTSGSDDISGLASCTAAQSQTTETTGTEFNGSCANDAGLTTNAAPLTVKLDKTGPSASLAVTAGTSGNNGWYTSDVTVSTSGSDSISGPASCTADQFQNTETAGTDFNGSCTNDAGLSTDAAPLTVKLDKTAPSASASAAPAANINGWNNTNVTVSFSGTDSLSGIDSCDAAVVLSSDGANQSASGDCTDKAGNVSATATASGINIDKTKPTISAAISAGTLGLNGWYVSDVTVHFTCADALSGAGVCPADQVLSTEGLAVSSTAQTVMDAAGNTSDLSNVVTVKIDKTAPTVALIGGPAHGNSYYFGSVPAAPTCNASDAVSGLDGSCTVSGYGATVGFHTVTASAKDLAGNTSSASATYEVKAWRISGFYQPVDMDKLNISKNGSTVPLKFEVFAGSTELTNTNIVSTFVQKLTCGTGAAIDDIESYSTGGTSLRYDTTGGQFIFNWQTPKIAGNCYRVTLTTTDGTSISADFKLK
jgi:hypothetical protein